MTQNKVHLNNECDGISLWWETTLTLTTRAIVQALMDVNITIQAEVLVAFWAANMETSLAICKDIWEIINEPAIATCKTRNIEQKV